MKIKTKLQPIIIVNIFSLVSIVSFSLLWQERAERQLNQQALVMELNRTIFEQAQSREEYLLYGEDRSKEQFMLMNKQISGLLERMQGAFTRPEEKASLIKMVGFHNKVEDFWGHLVRLNQSPPVSTTSVHALRERIISQMLVNAHSIYIEGFRLLNAANKKTIYQSRLTLLYSNIVFGLLASFIVAFAVIIVRSMAYPLTQLHKGTEIIAEGNFDYKTNIRTPDEIGQLSTAFDAMTEYLKKITVSRDGLSQEIKIRMEAEEALRESEEKFSKAFQTAPYAITITRAEDGVFVEVNEAFSLMTGFTLEESLASSSVELKIWVNEEDRQSVVAALGKGQAVVGKEFQFRTKIGKVITCLFSAQIIRLSIGNCILSSINDLTERKQVEEEKAKLEGHLRQAQKMESIGSLAGGIAHDLNNILFPISGLSEMLLDDIPPDTHEYKSVEQIHKSAKRGSDLVKQILSLSRQSNPQKLPIRIQPILTEALKLAEATIPKNIEITSHINTNCGMVSADPTQIHQIAMNLITNAFHAVEQHGGVIDIALKEMTIRYFGEKDEITFNAMPEELLAGRYACITVSDTGTGIDQTLIDKIFDPYFTTKELGKGTGLGLSVVHGIIKEHGGDIRVYSEVGKGTAFHVYLPLLEDAGDSKTAAVTRKYPTGSERILLVDDEETIVLLEQMMLERLGYQVTARTSSPDTLAAFKANPGNFDLVISDKSMPLMTGERLAMEMILIKPGIPVIICTGFSDENDVKRAKAMGVKGFLMKPMAIGDLAEMVRNVLDEVTDSASANEKKEAF